MQSQLVYNAIRTPDGTVLQSKSTHDYHTYIDSNGKEYMIDGGLDYVRSSYNGDEEFIQLYTDDLHRDIRELFTWGTYGPNGDQPLAYVLLKDLSIEHITNIIGNCHILPWLHFLFANEIEYRNDH